MEVAQMMNDKEFTATQKQIMLVTSIVRDLDLIGFSHMLEIGDALGPLVDLTSHRLAAVSFDNIRRVVLVMKQLQSKILEVYPDE